MDEEVLSLAQETRLDASLGESAIGEVAQHAARVGQTHRPVVVRVSPTLRLFGVAAQAALGGGIARGILGQSRQLAGGLSGAGQQLKQHAEQPGQGRRAVQASSRGESQDEVVLQSPVLRVMSANSVSKHSARGPRSP
ncbi:hypothetical protein D3C85_848180 [compost metagenome]